MGYHLKCQNIEIYSFFLINVFCDIIKLAYQNISIFDIELIGRINMYQVNETKKLLEEIIILKNEKIIGAEILIEAFFEFLKYEIICDEDEYLVEAIAMQDYNCYTEEYEEEKMHLILTRQMIYEGVNSFFQTSLNISFQMTPYFEKYRLKINFFSFIKLLIGKNRHSIWATKDSKNYIPKLISDILRNGVFETYVVTFQDAE